jgi:hypothetical protein
MKPTGCIRCGAAGAHVLFPLELVACESCSHAWIAEESLSVEAVCAALGLSPKPEDFTKSHQVRFDVELLRRTLAWAQSAREAA